MKRHLDSELHRESETWSGAFRPLAAVRRGPLIEVVHHGAIVAVYPDGRLAGAIGSPDQVIYLRSSAKPLQVVPLLASGAADRFGFSPKELAVMAGSHSGTQDHVETVRRALQRIGLDESALQCGTHWPLSRQATDALVRFGEKPRPIHNNCSGKHTAMLALARYRGYPTDDYYRADHPVQREIIDALALLSDTPAKQIILGIDGCGVPVHGLPLRASAQAFARLVDPAGLPPAWADACRRIVSAMQAHPEMVAGEGRICTALLETLSGKIVTKSGAEGFTALGILPGQIAGISTGLGIAIKLADGNFETGAHPVAIETLRQLGVADSAALQQLYQHFPLETLNCRQERVGAIQLLFAFHVKP